MTVNDVYRAIRKILPKELLDRCTFHISESYKINKYFNTTDAVELEASISAYYHNESQFTWDICYWKGKDLEEGFAICLPQISAFIDRYKTKGLVIENG